jgi:hypothetical protein
MSMSGEIGVKRGLKRSLGALIVQVLAEEASDEGEIGGLRLVGSSRVSDLCCLGEALMCHAHDKPGSNTGKFGAAESGGQKTSN